MWHGTAHIAGGLFSVCTAAWLAPLTGSVAQSTSFDARWLAVNPTQKADRIDEPKPRFDGKMYFFDLPTMQTTVVIKDHRQPVANEPKQTDGIDLPQNGLQNGSMKQSPVRILPHNVKGKEKMPVGCESSFSPVTTPAMANVSGRCLS